MRHWLDVNHRTRRKTMKTLTTHKWRTWMWSTATAGLLAVTLSSGAMALPSDASGHMDINETGFATLEPDSCFASSGINASGQSDFPVAWRLRRDGVAVATDVTTSFQANNGTIQFLPGTYELRAVNNQRPTESVRLTMSLVCH
jgi:hypothetical protein